MKKEVLQYRKRWTIVNAAEIQELRASSLADKALQTSALMESATFFGRTDLDESQEQIVRERWNALRNAADKR